MSAIAPMSLPSGFSPFDAIKREGERGEFWTGRQMQPLMDYLRWEDFAVVIEKAKGSLALVQGDEAAEHHFGKSRSDGGRWGNQRIEDYDLTRFGAYLTAMAGDDTKEAVAQARVYFAVRARQAEVQASATPKVPSSFAEALELAAAQARELEQAQAALAEAAPKIEAHDNLIQYGANRTVGEVAKELSTPERNIMVSELRRLIVHEWKWAFVKTRECGSAQYTPYAHKTDYLALGEEKYPHETRPDCWHATMRITPKGREAIRRKLDRENAPQALPLRAVVPSPSADEISTMIRRGA
ncbi:phage antirepressor KilAC domain-containing protein [Streptomyces avermitilis]|uniref:phage antirepressor KilAC domain-containing protein n=1 Tax=Streptomyces avermitilis TaxID=33903 RepID=UPI00380E9480